MDWKEKRDAWWLNCHDSGLVDLYQTWSQAATPEAKIKLCLEAHTELGWDAAQFDTQGQRVCNKWRGRRKATEAAEERKVLLSVIT